MFGWCCTQWANSAFRTGQRPSQRRQCCDRDRWVRRPAYAFTRVGEHGWADPVTAGTLAAAIVLLTVFVVIQARSGDPLLPLRLFADRNRSGAYAHRSVHRGRSDGHLLPGDPLHAAGAPVRAPAGRVAALPFGVGIIVASGIASKLVEKLPPRMVAVPGLLLAAGGMLWLSRLEADAGYWGTSWSRSCSPRPVSGLAFVPMTLTVVHGVANAR